MSNYPPQGNLAPTIVIGEIDDAALVIESEGISSNDNDTTFPTSAAVKDYVDNNTVNSPLTSDLNFDGFNADNVGVIFIKEQADADADVAGSGQIWVNTATPNELYFTDDAGTDFKLASTSNKLSDFAATTSAELAGVISDETGSGALVFGTSPTFVTPALGTPASGVATNLTGTSGITGLGAQTQTLDLSAQDIDNVKDLTLDNTALHLINVDRTEALADDTAIGEIQFRAHDGVPALNDYANIVATMESDVNASEDGSLKFQVAQAGTHNTNFITLNDASSGNIELLKSTNITGTLTADTYTGQTDIVTLGTIATGTWQGTAVASAYLDADTAHLSVAQTFSGAKTFEDDGLKIQNPATTFAYTITGAAIAADRTLTLPLTTGADTLMSLGLDQTVTGTLTLTTPVLGTPTSGTLTNCTGLPITGITSSTSAEIATLCSDETGSGALVFATSPTLVTPALGTPASGVATNLTGTSGITGLGTQTQILNTDTFGIQFSEANQDIIGSAAGIVYDVPTGDTHAFHINSAATATFSATGLDLASGDKFSENSVNISPIGLQEIWIPAGAMGTVTTNGAEFAELELATNDIMLQTFNFDTTTSEKAQFWWTPPLNWDAGTVKFKLYWTETGGGASETVDFDLAGIAYADDDAIDAAVGTAQNVTDTNKNVDNDMHITAYSNAITIGGTPVAGEPVLFQLSRDVAADNLAVDAKVLGIMLEFTTDAATSA